MKQLLPRILGFIVIVITLALAPTINTANAVIVAENLTNLIGMTAIAAFGAPLIILGLLTVGGVFAVAGVKGQLTSGVGDMMKVIGAVVIVIVSLTLFESVITYTNTLIGASSGFAVVIYGIIPIIIYVGIIVGAGWVSISAYRKGRKGGKGRSSRSFV